jgi:hypothetical protein
MVDALMDFKKKTRISDYTDIPGGLQAEKVQAVIGYGVADEWTMSGC